jgi:hypothetical protein
MAVRDGMLNVIAELRGLTQAGTADFTVNGVAYHSSQQLQDTLDKYARQYNDRPLEPNPDYIAGTTTYTRYFMPQGRFEEADSGTAVWRLANSLGSAFGTADYSVNYALGEVTMTEDTEGSAVYLTARAYNLNRAAAEIWSWKAGAYASEYDVQTDNHKLSRSQKIKNAHDMARIHRNEAIAEDGRTGAGMVRVRRVDIW